MYLFAYGTLLSPCGILKTLGIADKVEEIGEYTLPGYALYSLFGDEFPGIVPEENSAVHGRIYKTLDDSVIAAMDAYEEYSPDNERESLYVRRQVSETKEGGSVVPVYSYVFNKPLQPGWPRIDHGSWLRYLAK